MKKLGCSPCRVGLIFFFVCIHAFASTTQPPAPVIFFSDIYTGPNSGNSDTTYSATGGAYVTLYGNYLDNYSAITLNGSSCLTVVSGPSHYTWPDGNYLWERMIVKIGTTCTTGNWSITTPGGTFTGPTQDTTKEGLGYDFTVVSGNIWYTSPSGSDSNSGTFSSPFATPSKMKNAMSDNDIGYILNGFTSTTPDPNEGCGVLCLGGSATTECPTDTAWPGTHRRAMLGYPGATVTLGSSAQNGIPGVGFYGYCYGKYTLGEMTVYGGTNAIAWSENSWPHKGMRLIAMNASCPTASQPTGCYAGGGEWAKTGTAGSPPCPTCLEYDFVMLGSVVHDVGTNGGADNQLQQGAYQGDATGLIFGYNYVYNTLDVCRGFQLYSSSSGFAFHDVHFYNNIVHDTGCDGMGIYDYDPSCTIGPTCTTDFGGGIEVFNNVVWNAGNTGGSESAGSSGIAFYDDNNTSSTYVYSYNNTVYNDELATTGCSICGAMSFTLNSGVNTKLWAQNNLLYQIVNPPPYFWCDTVGYCVGSNNLAYGVGVLTYATGGSYPGGDNCWNCALVTNWVNSANGGSANPLLTNTSTSGCPDSCPTNLSLSSASSAAVGAGTTTSPVPTYDIQGLVRPSPPSIGAYEYAAGTQDSPPNPPTKLTATVN